MKTAYRHSSQNKRRWIADPLAMFKCINKIEPFSRDALMRCWQRYQHSGVFGFDGPALGEIEAGIDLHEQLIRLSTPLQMADALRTVIARGM